MVLIVFAKAWELDLAVTDDKDPGNKQLRNNFIQ